MTKLNLILFFVLILTALGTVTSQHKARKLYVELQQQQDHAKQFEIEWGQLQLEQSAWATHGRIEQVARKELDMTIPRGEDVVVLKNAER